MKLLYDKKQLEKVIKKMGNKVIPNPYHFYSYFVYRVVPSFREAKPMSEIILRDYLAHCYDEYAKLYPTNILPYPFCFNFANYQNTKHARGRIIMKGDYEGTYYRLVIQYKRNKIFIFLDRAITYDPPSVTADYGWELGI